MSDLTKETHLSLVLDLERELQTKACRSDRKRVLALLAADFVEVGASGRVWDLFSALQLLGPKPTTARSVISPGAQIFPDVSAGVAGSRHGG